MILSVSRRTDIPNYYSDWFFNRIKEGFVYVKNPMNPHQVSKIGLSPEVVDCIVFWTKNPKPMMDKLEELSSYDYYFQFTLTGYGKDIESNVPHKRKVMIPIFQELSEKIGKERVIWRYDPILFTKTYTPEYHLKAFEQIARALKGYAEKCVISFVDEYTKNKKRMAILNPHELGEEKLLKFVKRINEIASENGIKVGSCAEAIDLESCGIEHNCCIEKALIERITGSKLEVKKDKNQRKECGCMESIDIGTYNTCRNGCRYCYANYSDRTVQQYCNKYDPASPVLCGIIEEKDHITERKIKSLKQSDAWQGKSSRERKRDNNYR